MRWIGLALAAVMALSACQQRTAARTSGPPRVVVVEPSRRDMVRSITLPGDLIGAKEAALHANVQGYVRSIGVDKGDRVHKGQVLAVLEVPELAQQLERAKAEYRVKQLTADRTARVWHEDARLIALEDVDAAAGAASAAAAEVAHLEALVGYTHIVAPFDGVVTARYVDPGALMQSAGQLGTVLSGGSVVASGPAPLVTIADIDSLRVYVYVPESDTGSIDLGQRATVRLAQFPGRDFHGTVARFSKALDLRTRTMLTEVDLPNPDHTLYPGMSGDVTIEFERHAGALTLPVTAVNQSPSGPYVLAVRDGHLVQMPVQTGFRRDETIEITSGLRGGEQVARYPSAQLEVGSAVEAVTGDTSLAAAS